MSHSKEAKSLTFWRGSEVSQEVFNDPELQPRHVEKARTLKQTVTILDLSQPRVHGCFGTRILYNS